MTKRLRCAHRDRTFTRDRKRDEHPDLGSWKPRKLSQGESPKMSRVRNRIPSSTNHSDLDLILVVRRGRESLCHLAGHGLIAIEKGCEPCSNRLDSDLFNESAIPNRWAVLFHLDFGGSGVT